MALNPVDRLLGGYLAFLTLLILVRGPTTGANPWMLLMHALFAALLYLFTRLAGADRVGRTVHTLYPLLMLLPLYTELGLLNLSVGMDAVMANDAVIQDWEEAIFGSQVSYTWIRESPSVFWSGVLHLAYFAYYPVVTVGPAIMAVRGRHNHAAFVIFATLTAFVACYVTFALYPVGGPNYAFEHPTGPVRDVWSARIVYGMLAGGSSFGTAFPSSHVAATLAATSALWFVWRGLAVAFALPAVLLTIGTVYCQMHYGIDASAGAIVGFLATWIAWRSRRRHGLADEPGYQDSTHAKGPPHDQTGRPDLTSS